MSSQDEGHEIESIARESLPFVAGHLYLSLAGLGISLKSQQNILNRISEGHIAGVGELVNDMLSEVSFAILNHSYRPETY